MNKYDEDDKEFGKYFPKNHCIIYEMANSTKNNKLITVKKGMNNERWNLG